MTPDLQSSRSRRETASVSLPESFFTRVMPEIQDLAELKIVLSAAYLILGKRGHPEFVTYKELKTAVSQLSVELTEATLRQALDSAVQHAALLRSVVKTDEVSEDVYSLPFDTRQPPAANIFALYEQNIGLITPMVAEELKDAERLYPPEWIEDAFKEAAELNKRNWRYIARILERWASEGKDSGEYRRDAEKDGPDKYVKGRYGHLVKR
jgi:DNA replication protein